MDYYTRNDNTYRNKSIGRHMKEGAFDVDIPFLPLDEQPCSHSVDNHTGSSHPRDSITVHFCRMHQFSDRFDQYGTDGHIQEKRIDERSLNREFL